MKIIEFKAKGMHCVSCEKIIKDAVLSVKGVKSVEIDYSTEEGKVAFDENKTNINKILHKAQEKGYECVILVDLIKKPLKKFFGWLFGIIGVIVVGYFIFRFVDVIELPEISQNMGYGLLFLVGILTGFHCVSMCGGFVLSYTAKNAQDGIKPHKSHLMYGAGKLISYTLIGACFGLMGSIIAFTPFMRGVAGVVAGLFLILFGLKMLNIFPVLRKLSFRTPKFIVCFVGKESEKHSSPLIIGLLNGLMIACGPLQAIYIMAAGTGSMIEGAKLLFIFALGTLPVMLGFGYLASIISNKATNKILKASGVVVIILGVVMLNRGLALTGSGYDFNSFLASVSASNVTGNMVAIEDGYQTIRMDVTKYGWNPDRFILKKNVPVKWIINGKEITGCNNAIQVPKLDLEFDIKKGEQIIEFTPKKEGIISWSCWMGMIPGVFIVKDDISDAKQVEKELASIKTQRGSCGGSCGSSSCSAVRGGSCGCGG